MNKKYAFILGNNTALSVAEVYEVLKRKKVLFSVLDISKEAMLLECPDLKDTTDLKDFGGTIKIVEIFSETEKDDIPGLVTLISEMISKDPKKSKKYRVGISVYDLNAEKKSIYRVKKSINFLNINIKKSLKEKDVNISFIRTDKRALSSASVLKNKLTRENGKEICLFVQSKSISLGKTIDVQNIDLYTKLDIGRPQRDLVSGTTPPKLAKIMINLAGKDAGATMIDPFCGSGTFIQEMLLLGYKKIYSCDISEKAIKDTEENLKWLEKEVSLDTSSVEIFRYDAKKLSERFERPTVDAVVTETYLGPPLRSVPSDTELSEISKELSSLFASVLMELGKIIKESGRIVMAIPLFNQKGRKVFLPIEKSIKDAGFKTVNLLKEGKYTNPGQFSQRETLIYSRLDQLVFREIIVLEKTD